MPILRGVFRTLSVWYECLGENYPDLGEFVGFSRHLGLEAHSRAEHVGLDPFSPISIA